MATEEALQTGRSLQIGLVGTGFVAKLRVGALASDSRATVSAVTSHRPDAARDFANNYHIDHVYDSWQELVQQPKLDMVMVCNINCDHAPVTRAALNAGKSVVVEYPLALSATEAVELTELAQQRGLLLHVEHIELLGGLHQAMRANLSKIGTPLYVRYCTATPVSPAPQKWAFHKQRFGFPLMGALSRIHRLTNLFGAVDWVASQIQYADGGQAGYFCHCRCVAQLRFQSGLMAEVLYAKGERTWRSQRRMEVEGDRGALVFEREQGALITADGETPIEVGSRRGLFVKDTIAVLDKLLDGKPLYVTPQESLYALEVAAAASAAARTGQIVTVNAVYPEVSSPV
ncbi:MAG: Gfo/Idh/MocA family oxidoreductase [Cyanobacteria bacterium P01_C01_bin.120]